MTFSYEFFSLAGKENNSIMEDLVLISLSLRRLELIIDGCVKRAFNDLVQGNGFGNQDMEILDISGAAKFLNLAVPTIYGLTSSGKIPHFKQGKKLYFRKSELIAWIESGRVKTEAEIMAEAHKYIKK